MINKKNQFYKTKRFWAGILLAQFLLFYTFSKIDFFVNVFNLLFDLKKKWHQQMFSSFPFSVGDILYIILGMVLIYFVFKIYKKESRPQFLIRLIILLNIFYFVYQFSWGMMYFQTPIREKLPQGKITLEETKILTKTYLNLCKETRTFLEEDKNGVFEITDLKDIKAKILSDQKQLPSIVGKKRMTYTNSFKPSFYKGIMSYSGILGYYNPFTAEAQYNAKLPATFLPFTLAHESAHQLGFAREQEANFVGYLIGIHSENSELRYSTQYFVLKSLLHSLSEEDPYFVGEIIQNYSPGMKRDRLAEKEFIQRHEGSLDIFFRFTNDLFLKSNQQEGSITYSYFVELLLQFEKSQHFK